MNYFITTPPQSLASKGSLYDSSWEHSCGSPYHLINPGIKGMRGFAKWDTIATKRAISFGALFSSLKPGLKREHTKMIWGINEFFRFNQENYRTAGISHDLEILNEEPKTSSEKNLRDNELKPGGRHWGIFFAHQSNYSSFLDDTHSPKPGMTNEILPEFCLSKSVVAAKNDSSEKKSSAKTKIDSDTAEDIFVYFKDNTGVIRKEPDKKSKKLGQGRKGDKAKFLGMINNWIYIKYKGQEVWTNKINLNMDNVP